MRRLLGASALVVFCALTLASGGCANSPHNYSQAALNALQSREFDASFDRTFDATVGALFDLGYTITTSDKRGGVLGASRTTVSFDVQQQSVSIKVEASGRRTLVRVSTSRANVPDVDEEAIKSLLDRIDRRLTMKPA